MAGRGICASVPVMSDPIVFQLNGKPVEVATGRPLLEVLRDELGLTGTKYGCGEGSCGACTVLVDGRAARSCVTRVDALGGKEVTTIEGLADGGKLHPVQRAFLEEDALQCGYCTCGMVMSAVALLREHPEPDEDQFLAAMDGNICRCGVYPLIRTAVRRAGETMRKEAAR